MLGNVCICLAPCRVGKPQKEWHYHVANWYRDLIRPAGVECMVEFNAAAKAALKAKQKDGAV